MKKQETSQALDVHRIENWETTALRQWSATVGYQLDEVIKQTEPPLQRVLRQAGIGYFDHSAVKSKMAQLEFRANVKAGVPAFLEYVAGKSASLRWVIDCMQTLVGWLAMAIYIAPLIFAGFAMWKVFGPGWAFATSIIVSGMVWNYSVLSHTDRILFLNYMLNIADIGKKHVWVWRKERIDAHLLPVPEEALACAAELKMRATYGAGCLGTEILVYLLDSDQRREQQKVNRGVLFGGISLHSSEDRVSDSAPSAPDPFLAVSCRSFIPDPDPTNGWNWRSLGKEEFFVAYYAQADFASSVDLK